ncbi:MAG: UMP kinase [Clostridia bacterium]|nr:UMP kinase [Clostridia bacterium]
MSQKYKRILLKISGEALAGESKFGINFETLKPLAKVIKNCSESGVQIAIVVGGGNFWRGRTSGNMNRVKADHMGMLATVINAIGLSDALEEQGVKSQVMTSIAIPQVGELYSPEKAIKHLEKGEVVIFGYGTGNAFFSTDTAASLRAAEIQAEIIFKATNVDGVYDSDPSKNPDAKKYSDITFKEVLAKNLNVMDSTAASMCRDNDISLLVFSMKDPNNISKAINGENLGTVVHP